MKDIPVTLGFDESGDTLGWITLGKNFEDLPNPAEYFIAPAAQYDPDTHTWKIVGYSFVHVSNLPTAEQLKAKLKGITG